MKLRAYVSAPRGKGSNPHIFKSNKGAFLTLEYKAGGKYPNRFDAICFSDLLQEVSGLVPGEEVDVELDLGTKKLTDKNGGDVISDDRPVYVTQAILRSVKNVTGGLPKENKPAVFDDDIPF